MWQVIGQPKAIALLERSFARGHLSHAYLLVGPCHVGKMTLALNLAQALNCDDEDRPCNECVSCRRIASGKHADVQVVGLSGDKREIGIEQIKQMHVDASFPPFEGRNKVFIIDGAEQLSLEAANCLLKILEEPLPHVLLLLITSRENLLLPTIVSRCQRVELSPLSLAAMKEVLSERYHVADERVEIIARLSKGCLGWAVAALQDERLLQERARRLAVILDISHARRQQRLPYAAELALEFSRNPSQIEEVLALWLDWWRDLLLVKTDSSEFITNSDHRPELLRQAAGYSLEQIKDMICRLQVAGKQLDQNANPRLVLEALMLSMPDARGSNN